ncbi:hypothetical protein N7G274_004391 [Stereocaulon virgatum]|uniref:Integrase zinc-binding domain-containing protein n=1 Tax=Stereocaulon virgatum TaxID=373712 RepID=A0ABR4ADL9_9LECA
MMCTPSNNLVTFTSSTKTAFLQHLREKSTNRHITQTDKDIIIEWLTNPHKRPSSQKEFSRRNYILKTFAWDEKTQSLFAAAKTDAAKDRTVVTENTIADVVEFVHGNNKHGGWDATWRDISSSYYGILRSDVIYLLKQCQTCALNPSKRPKGSAATIPSSQPIDHEPLGFLSTGEVEYDISAWDVQENGEHSGE